jgi:hypothetical protein
VLYQLCHRSLIVVNPGEEIQYKYSTHQMALSGISKLKDNLNKSISFNDKRLNESLFYGILKYPRKSLFVAKENYGSNNQQQ